MPMPSYDPRDDDEFLDVFADWQELRLMARLADEGRPLPPIIPPATVYIPPAPSCDADPAIDSF